MLQAVMVESFREMRVAFALQMAPKCRGLTLGSAGKAAKSDRRRRWPASVNEQSWDSNRSVRVRRRHGDMHDMVFGMHVRLLHLMHLLHLIHGGVVALNGHGGADRRNQLSLVKCEM
jgi:hypothetical protein